MPSRNSVSRRSFLSSTASVAMMSAATRGNGKHVPVGLELYSVRDQLKEELMGTVRAVAKMGYEDVEFYSPYFAWTVDYAKDVRKLLDDLGVRCLSTHNDSQSFTPENLPRAIALNQIIGSKLIVMASGGRVQGLDGWKGVAERLNQAADKLKPQGLRTGYHNHAAEFRPVDGRRPIEIIAENTGKEAVLQFDVGTCIEAGP